MNLYKSLPNVSLLSSFISLASILALTFQLNAQTDSTLPQMNIEEPELSVKPTPVSDVAGGLGKEGYTLPKYAVLPTGKTLPKGIFRAEFPTAYTFGDFGYDQNGKIQKNGLNTERWITGTKIEYGLSNTITLAIGIPYTVSNSLSIDKAAVQSTELYQKYYNKFVSQFSAGLAATPYGASCGNNQTLCTAAINSGASLSSGTVLPIILPTGESSTINSTSSIKSQISNLVTGAATPSSGATGLGDIQIGMVWNIISEDTPIRHVPLYFTIGGGVRLPTGQFDLPSAMRSTGGDGTLVTGGGTYDAILRWNLDYVATPGIIISWQHQMEYSLTTADLGRSSMLDPTQKNSANAKQVTTYSGIPQQGDTIENTLTFKRKGIHQIGFLQAAWGVGNIEEDLKWLGLFTQAKYNIAAKAFLNDLPIYTIGDQFFLGDSTLHLYHGQEQFYSAVAGAKISGLPYRIPLELSAEFEYPLAGSNRIISPMNAQTTVVVYF